MEMGKQIEQLSLTYVWASQQDDTVHYILITLSNACLTYEMKVKHNKYIPFSRSLSLTLFVVRFFFSLSLSFWPHSRIKSEFLLSSNGKCHRSWKIGQRRAFRCRYSDLILSADKHNVFLRVYVYVNMCWFHYFQYVHK